MNKDIKTIIEEITKSQANAKNILETFAYDNKINLDINSKKILATFINDIKEDMPTAELFDKILEKLK